MRILRLAQEERVYMYCFGEEDPAPIGALTSGKLCAASGAA